MKRIQIITGHYGSGKTNVAVNVATELKKTRDTVTVADLDIVNPYFRTKDSAAYFEEQGIRLICSAYANSNVDIPALPQEMYALTDDRSMTAVLDIGGDDRGALAMGRYAPKLLEENSFDMFAVINRFRPLTSDAESTLEVMREIEFACKMPFTGIVNNSNLGKDTTEKDVLSSLEYAEEVSRLTGLPIVMNCVLSELYPALSEKISKIFPINIYVKAKI